MMKELNLLYSNYLQCRYLSNLFTNPTTAHINDFSSLYDLAAYRCYENNIFFSSSLINSSKADRGKVDHATNFQELSLIFNTINKISEVLAKKDIWKSIATDVVFSCNIHYTLYILYAKIIINKNSWNAENYGCSFCLQRKLQNFNNMSSLKISL